MKKKIAIGAGILALSLALAPAAMAAGAAQTSSQIEQTNSAWTSVALDAQTKDAEYTVYLVGSSETSSDPAQVKANTALANAHKYGFASTDKMTGFEGKIIKHEFYLGMKDSNGNPVDGAVDLAVISVEDAKDITAVAYWNVEQQTWTRETSFSVDAGIVTLGINAPTGVYRLLADKVDQAASSAVPSVQQTGLTIGDGTAQTDEIKNKKVAPFIYNAGNATAALCDDAVSYVKNSLSAANASGLTADSMKVGVSGTVTDQFYLGIHDTDGNIYGGSVTVPVKLGSSSEVDAIKAVVYYNGSSWQKATWTKAGASIAISGHTGVYRIIC